jgi:anti-sigma regulatory factor (Ser/Thr protein kinase)
MPLESRPVPVADPEEASRSFPSDRNALGAIRAFIRGQARAGPFAEWMDSFVLAANEASANAILHSGSPEISVTWRAFGDRAEVEVRDRGMFVRAAPEEDQGRSGRGILLIMSTMDQVTITCGTDAHPGTVVRMVKLRNGRPATAPRAP